MGVFSLSTFENFHLLFHCLDKNHVLQYGLASWLPWSSALTPKINGSQTDICRCYALCLDSIWYGNAALIASSKVAPCWPTSKNLVGELGDCWSSGISRLGRHKKLMLKEDWITVIQRSWLSSNYNLCCPAWAECAFAIDFFAKYRCLAQKAWATFLCSALTYLEGLYTCWPMNTATTFVRIA